jgi:hypothetical protein
METAVVVRTHGAGEANPRGDQESRIYLKGGQENFIFRVDQVYFFLDLISVGENCEIP